MEKFAKASVKENIIKWKIYQRVVSLVLNKN